MGIAEKFQMMVEEELKEKLNGDIIVRIDEEKDELFICVKVEGIDEFAQIIDHVSDEIFDGKAPDDFARAFMGDYWEEVTKTLERKVFKK